MAGTNGRYICTRAYNPNGDICTEPSVAGKLVEHVTWDYIIDLITNPDEFEERLKKAQAQEAKMRQPKQKELSHIDALLKETENEAEEVARATPKAKGIIAQKLQQQAIEIDRRFQALVSRKTEILETINLQLTDDNINDLLKFRNTVAVGLKNPTFDDKRRWMEILQASVTVRNRIAVVTCRLGGKPLQFRISEVNKS